MAESQRTVWVIGDWRLTEFADPMTWLKAVAPCLLFHDAGLAVGKQAAVVVAADPAAILLLQSRPGQFSPRAVERLHAAAPLARLVALVGAWCEGEERSGRPSPGVVRVPIVSWQCRLRRELGLPVDALATRLPRTATASERLEAELRAGAFPSRAWKRGEYGERGVHKGIAAVYASNKPSFDAISDLLCQVAIDSSWCEARSEVSPTVSLVVVDGWEQASALPPVAKDTSVSRLLLLHFPRDEDIARAKMYGFDAVLKKPLMLMDLSAAAALTAAACRN